MIRGCIAVVVLLVACERPDWGNGQVAAGSGSASATAAPTPPPPTTTTTPTPPTPTDTDPPDTLRMGDKVSAQWTNGKWYRGTLTAVYSDGTADVRYDDGDRSRGLPFEKIKLVKRPLFEAEVPSAKASNKRKLVEGASCAGVGWQYVCGGRCTDTKTDSANCGGCGRRCDSGYACDGSGTCRDANGNL